MIFSSGGPVFIRWGEVIQGD